MSRREQIRSARYTQAGRVSLHSREWRDLVNARLQAGYGTEDIAVWLDCSLVCVQRHVDTLRARGALRRWFPAGSAHLKALVRRRIAEQLGAVQ